MHAPAPSSHRWLPSGGTLPGEVWHSRHRVVVALVAVHVPALLLFAVLRGRSLDHGLVDVGPIIVCTVLASLPALGERTRATIACLGLMICSAVLVHLWDGVTEAHFHFFVAVALLALYEDWIPWLTAFAFVLIHHVVMGVVVPRDIYEQDDVLRNPILWAAIHAGFIAALGLVNLATWRATEGARWAERRSASRLEWQARHDPLTGLPNRTEFVHCAEDAFERRSAESGPVAMLFVDVDDFKNVNDTLGHDAGDQLLTLVASRLSETLRPPDVVARFGGDEFAVLLPGVRGEAEAMRIAERLTGALRAPIVLNGQPLVVSASVGLAVGHPRGDGAEDAADQLLKDADAAMYHAKQLGKARYQLYDKTMKGRRVERVDLHGLLRDAIAREELHLVYQPQVALPGGELIGVEALLRWHPAGRDPVPPDVFIPMAERLGLIGDIGALVLRRACEQAMAWGAPDLRMSVNVSPHQLGDADFPACVRAILEDTGMDPAKLCLEVTESTLVADVRGAAAILRGLQETGVLLAVDDFGVGEASLRHLRELLPVNIIKIDKSFIKGLPADSRDVAIVGAVIRLGEAFGLETVAEGVENTEQARALAELGCPVVQGYHFGRPASPEVLARQLTAAPAAGVATR